MSIAAVDYGRRRLGIAASDPAGLAIHPVTTIIRSSVRRDLEALRVRFEQMEVSRIIVGLPLNMDGTRGPAADAAAKFARQLQEKTGLPVELCDERLSTFEAEERLRAAGSSRERSRPNDALAAAIILESWFRARGMV